MLGFMAAAIEFQAPVWIDKMLTVLSGAAAPCALFSMGVSVALRRVNRVPLGTFGSPPNQADHPSVANLCAPGTFGRHADDLGSNCNIDGMSSASSQCLRDGAAI